VSLEDKHALNYGDPFEFPCLSPYLKDYHKAQCTNRTLTINTWLGPGSQVCNQNLSAKQAQVSMYPSGAKQLRAWSFLCRRASQLRLVACFLTDIQSLFPKWEEYLPISPRASSLKSCYQNIILTKAPKDSSRLSRDDKTGVASITSTTYSFARAGRSYCEFGCFGAD
jgi:hypothetical protein